MKFVFCWFFLSVFLTLAAQGDGALWQGIEPSDKYDFFLVENFEEGHPWQFSAAKAVASFARNGPAEFLTAQARETDGDLKSQFARDQQFAETSATQFRRDLPRRGELAKELFIPFMHPGQESQIYKPVAPVKIYGLPRAVAFYLKSYEQRHTISLLFSAPGLGVLELAAADLLYKGWRRIEVPLPVHFHRRNPRNQNRHEIMFHGIKIQSHPREPAGLCQLAIDQIMVLTDRSEEQLPGAAQKDNWR